MSQDCHECGMYIDSVRGDSYPKYALSMIRRLESGIVVISNFSTSVCQNDYLKAIDQIVTGLLPDNEFFAFDDKEVVYGSICKVSEFTFLTKAQVEATFPKSYLTLQDGPGKDGWLDFERLKTGLQIIASDENVRQYFKK